MILWLITWLSILGFFLPGSISGCSAHTPKVAKAQSSDFDFFKSRDVVSKTSAVRKHVVRSGDTLWRIAQKHGLTTKELARFNGIAEHTTLYPGGVLKVPLSGGLAGGGAGAGVSAYHRRENVRVLAQVLAKGQRAPDSGVSESKRSGVALASGEDDPMQEALARVRAVAVGVESGEALQWPVLGAVGSPFGLRHGRAHDGIDITAPEGTVIRAAAAGEVIFADYHRGYGNLVVLRHNNGLVTIYAHQKGIEVKKGQQVLAGQVIGKVGRTGNATGPHLHFEVRVGTRPENPLLFLAS